MRTRLNASIDSSSTPAAPALARTSRQAFHTNCFGITKGFAAFSRSSPFGLTRERGPITQPLRSGSIIDPSSLLRADPSLQRRIGTLSLAPSRLAVSLGIDVAGSCSSAREPESSSRHLYAGHHPPSRQVADGLVPGQYHVPGFDAISPFRHLNDGSRVFAFSILT